MKNLMLALFVMTAMVFSNDIQAQVTCTPAQKEACKKTSGENPTTCTPEQMAACQKTCAKKSDATSTTAVKVVNKAPTSKASCQPACSKTSTASVNTSPVKLVGLELFPQEKKMNCSKPCTGTAVAKVQE